MTKKLLLIDGSSLLSTSFYGNVPRSYHHTGDTSGIMKTTDGRFTNGVYTMSKVLLNLIEKQQPTHIAVAWDISRDTFRRERYSDYKAHRKETKPELSSQFALMQEVIDSMGGIAQYKLENYEADDIIGTFAKKFENEIPVYILTKDQDALQLITETTKVWLNTTKSKDLWAVRGLDPSSLSVPAGSFEFTPQTFEEEYGLKPIQLIDMKALEGDTSDNIPGVKGVGPKAILPLLQEYGTVEGIYEALESIPEAELKVFFKEDLGISRSPIANLRKESDTDLVGKKAAYLSKELATIKTDIPVYEELKLDALRVDLDKGRTKAKFAELEFNSLIDKL